MTTSTEQIFKPVWAPSNSVELRLKQAHRSRYVADRIRAAENRLTTEAADIVCSLTFKVTERDIAASDYEKTFGPVSLQQ